MVPTGERTVRRSGREHECHREADHDQRLGDREGSDRERGGLAPVARKVARHAEQPDRAAGEAGEQRRPERVLRWDLRRGAVLENRRKRVQNRSTQREYDNHDRGERSGGPTGRTATVIDDPAVHAEVLAVFEAYESALLENDCDALDSYFWRDGRVVRIGLDDEQHGFEAVSTFRRGLQRQTPPRVLENTVIVTFGRDTAVVSTTFVPTDGSASGRQMQTWVRMSEGWRIVAAHVSFAASVARQGMDHKP